MSDAVNVTDKNRTKASILGRLAKKTNKTIESFGNIEIIVKYTQSIPHLSANQI